MTDFLLLEKIHGMIAGKPGPRLLYKKGIYLRGFFRPYMPMTEYTRAEVFDDIEKTVPVTVRFSSMLGDEGTADTRRNIKGMAVKFHGNNDDHDIMSQNIPVFFINREKILRELIGALTCRTSFDRINSSRLWQLAVDHPEAVNCILRLYSCEGITDSFIRSSWYCVFTYIWKGNNEDNEDKVMVRYRWVPVSGAEKEYYDQSERKMSRISAEFMAGFDPDTAHEELETAVKEGRFPAFELQIQVADHKFISHPDYTRGTLCWNEKICRPVPVGVMKLTEVLGWSGKECDRVCFAPGNVMDGIELYRDDFSELIDYVCRISAVERGAAE